MQLDLSGIEEIVGCERIDDMGGTFLQIKFKNGAVLHIAPQNDVVGFYATQEDAETVGGKRSVMFCDMGAGHHEPQGEPYFQMQPALGA
jgi:hypothetical protein